MGQKDILYRQLSKSIVKDLGEFYNQVKIPYKLNTIFRIDKLKSKFIEDEEPKIYLNHLLLWLSLNNRNKYLHFEVISDKGFFIIYDSEEVYNLEYSLMNNELSEQSEEIIEFLHGLI